MYPVVTVNLNLTIKYISYEFLLSSYETEYLLAETRARVSTHSSKYDLILLTFE